MDIKGVVHCLFEQSGTFKNEFIKMGYKAYDYDIQNNFGETDNVIDLFAEIEKAYVGGAKHLRPHNERRLDNGFLPLHRVLRSCPNVVFVRTSRLSEMGIQGTH